jgi:L-threonylcarbamoyladenylate synthase
MILVSEFEIHSIVSIINQGGVIAYPTEAVFGLGCDPLNIAAIEKILAIKQRSRDKGLILIASSWEQLKFFVEELPEDRMEKIFNTWPGPFTWLFPAKPSVSEWIRGQHTTVAVRVSAHPIVQKICQTLGHPLISTSANREGQQPTRSTEETQAIFKNEIEALVQGETTGLMNPTEIRDARTGKIIRNG